MPVLWIQAAALLPLPPLGSHLLMVVFYQSPRALGRTVLASLAASSLASHTNTVITTIVTTTNRFITCLLSGRVYVAKLSPNSVVETPPLRMGGERGSISSGGNLSTPPPGVHSLPSPSIHYILPRNFYIKSSETLFTLVQLCYNPF